jgi:type IV pilus assembly protein PilQ
MKFLNKKILSYLLALVFLALSACQDPSHPLLGTTSNKAVTLDANNVNPETTGKNLRGVSDELSNQQNNLSKLNEDERFIQPRRTNLYNNITTTNKGDVPLIDFNADIKKLETIPVTLKMDELDLRAALKLFASLVNRNIIIGDEVNGTVTLDFEKMKWGSAVYALLDLKNLVMTADDSSKLLTVHTRSKFLQIEKDKIETSKTRFKNINSLNNQSSIVSDDTTENSAVFKIYYQTSKDMVAKIKETLATDEDGSVQIVEDPKNNQIVAIGTERQLGKIENILNSLDVKKKQILIEAYIVNATNTFERQLGARVGANYVSNAQSGVQQVSGLGGTSASSTSPTVSTQGSSLSSSGLVLGTPAGSLADFSFSGTSGIGIIGRLGMTRLKLEVDALQTQGITEVISNPKLYTMDGEQAEITQGAKIPYTVTGAQNVASSTLFVDAVLHLKIIPRIIGNGKILLDVDLTNDSAETAAANTAPIVDKKNIKSKISIDDRSIAVLGGVYGSNKTNSLQKTPLLGDLPVFGYLFQGQDNVDNKTQLLVFITATII